MLFFLFPSIFFLIYIIKKRRDFLCFTFLALFYFLFIAVPLCAIAINYESIELAEISLRSGLIFLTFFLLTYYLFSFNKNKDTSIYLFQESGKLNLLMDNAIYLVFLGIIMKIIGGDLVHSSIYDIPWKIPLFYGFADRVYYLGIMLSCISLYRYGFSAKKITILSVVFLLGIIGGSRVTILIPLAFFLLLKSSTSSVSRLMVIASGSVASLFVIIVFVGFYRIDSIDRGFDFLSLLDLFMFRISEFAWPAKLIQMIDSDQMGYNLSWIYSSLMGMAPSILSDYFLGESVFVRDTNLMLEVGIANEYMSVPLTPIGEGYYWFGDLGVVIISIFYALGFISLFNITSRLNPAIRMLLYLQLFRSTFALPVAAFPEFISFLTKDVAIDFIIVYFIIYVFGNFRSKNQVDNIHGVQHVKI